MGARLDAPAEVAAWLHRHAAGAVEERSPQNGQLHLWRVDLGTPAITGRWVDVAIYPGFPETEVKLFVDSENFLRVPHVERDGKVCVDVQLDLVDRDNPAAPVFRAFEGLNELLTRCQDSTWRQSEFQRERLSYWEQLCLDIASRSTSKPSLNQLYLDLSLPVAVTVTEIVQTGKAGFISTSQSPVYIAERHGLARGTPQRGEALVIPLDDGAVWTPAEWPRDFVSLDQLVAELTGQRAPRPGRGEQRAARNAPRVVAFVQQGLVFAYQVLPPPVPLLQPPEILPLQSERIDATWALFRGQTDSRIARRKKRLLLLGCGSLGSSVAETLAREGIGTLHLVDQQFFAPENTARHVLGLGSTNRFKAVELKAKLERDVPGLNAYAHPDEACELLSRFKEPIDMIIDVTGEFRVRRCLSEISNARLSEVPIVHAWMEHFAAAAHVVTIYPPDKWPLDDPADKHVNVAQWSEKARTQMPACGVSFSPYGAAECAQITGFVAETILRLIDGETQQSTVWSWVRPRSRFAGLPCSDLKNIVPSDSADGGRVIQRDFKSVISGIG